MIRRALQALLVLVVAVTASIAGQVATPAHAADEILVSSDGAAWGATISRPLFTDLGMMVPRDSETMSLWVKNATSTPVYVRLSVAAISSASTVFAESVTLRTSNSATSSTSTSTLAELADCQVLMASTPLAVGGALRIDFRVDMLDVTDRIAQSDVGQLDFMVAMRDGVAGPFAASACEDEGVTIPGITLPSQIAHTGYDLPNNWLVAAGAFVGFGFILIARRRRRREES